MITVKSISKYNKAYPSLNFAFNKEQMAIALKKQLVCDCCGFQTKLHVNAKNGFMQVFELAGECYLYCCLCAGSQSIGRSIDGTIDHGSLVYAPMISQGQLVDLYRIVSAARLLGSAYVNDEVCQRAFDIQNELTSLHVDRRVFPFLKSNPITLTDYEQIITHASPKVTENLQFAFSGVRYLPHYDISDYQESIKFWIQANPVYFKPLLKAG